LRTAQGHATDHRLSGHCPSTSPRRMEASTLRAIRTHKHDNSRAKSAERPSGHLCRSSVNAALAGQSLPLSTSMCHNVHMKTISIRELHLKTGQWVRHAASRGPIAVTDRGRRVAALQPFDASMTGRPLPNREAAIRKRSKVPVDSAVYQSELREDR